MKKTIISLFFIVLFVCSATAEIGSNWTLAGYAPYTARDHSSVSFNGKMYILGGFPNRKEVWQSTDGKKWYRNPTPQWSGRHGQTSVVFQSKIWVIGGEKKKDVWYSSDGKYWKQATSNAPWGERNDHASVVFRNKIWVIGGLSKGVLKNDVWSSVDGKTWKRVSLETVPYFYWSPRAGHTSCIFNNKIWIIGGYYYDGPMSLNDLWYSYEGTKWYKVENPILQPWSMRNGHTSVVHNNRMYIIGGTPYSTDVWNTIDGKNWTQVTASSPWAAREEHTSVIFNNRIWIIGGLSSARKISLGSIWYSK